MRLLALLLSAFGFSGANHAQSLLFFEDWDSTPPIPDDLRGWGYGAVAQNGFFIDSGGNPGGFIRQPPTLGSKGLFTNKPMGVTPIAGDANYLELEITRVCVRKLPHLSDSD